MIAIRVAGFPEPGIGKTALLEYAIESAAGFRIARAGGVESEMELAFAVRGFVFDVATGKVSEAS